MSTEEPRPWWASPAEAAASIDDEDPIVAARAARRRVATGPSADHAETGHGGHEPAAEADPRRAHAPDICGVCPICTAARVLGEARPEALAHLTEAVHHLAAALRSMVDVPSDPGTDGRERHGRERHGRDDGAAGGR